MIRPLHTIPILAGLAALIFLTACGNKLSDQKAAAEEASEDPLFTALASSETGITFRNEIPESGSMNNMVYEYFYNGGGVAVGDIDNDGLEDIYFVANLKENVLYRNTGNWRFEDITQPAGVAGSFGWSTGVCMADVNADGWLDIYVCKSGKGKAADRENELFINNQDGTFRESAREFGLNFAGYSTQATFFDYDKDGDLDLFLLNHNTSPIQTNEPEIYKEQYDELVGDKLYENQDGQFIDVSKQAGLINNPMGFGLGVSVSDLNQDGWPDLYIANDYIEQDYLYLNQGDGTFEEVLKTATSHTSNFSMGTDIADFNNDGLTDIFSLDMAAADNYGIKTSMSGMNIQAFAHAVNNGFHYQYMYNALQLNQGDMVFSEIAHLAGVSNTDWSWAPLFTDFDNDGWKDIFVTNGLKRDFRNNDFRKTKLQRLEQAQARGEKMLAVLEELVAQTPQRKTRNYLFQNQGDLTFVKRSQEWGMHLPSFSNGAAYADLDNDGDLDLIVNNIDDEAFVFQNNTNGNYLQIELAGSTSNPYGVGAKVTIRAGGQVQVLENYPTRGYQSSVSPLLHFGLGEWDIVDQIEVQWPDGRRSQLQQQEVNQRITFHYEKAGEPSGSKKDHQPDKLFTDYTAASGLYHRHVENQFDDFARESLLPHKMSQFGPALAVGDANGDGREDFFVGGAKGQVAELYFQQENGRFRPSGSSLWQAEQAYEDVDAVFFDADQDGDLDLYVVSGGNEFEVDSPYLQDRLYRNNGNKSFEKTNALLPSMLASGACVRPCDFDEDGDLDLFVGGRQVPGQYGFPAQSFLLENNGGFFKDITATAIPQAARPGMVTDAIWSDFNDDRQMDLLIVGEWMEIQFFANQGKSFQKVPIHFKGFDGQPSGWWSSIQAADFDQDGDQDFVVGNLGLNYKYQATPTEPFELYVSDFDENGSLDIVLGYYDQQQLYPLRGRECSSNQMPFIKDSFPTYHAFGSARLSQIYGSEKLENALHLSANTFATIYLENKGDNTFTFSPLPSEAQLSSVNGLLIDDWNGDQLRDILLAGNLYQSEIETPRNDAGIGLLLTQSPEGPLQAIPATESGLYLRGDIKKLRLIRLASTQGIGILAARNDDFLSLIRLN